MITIRNAVKMNVFQERSIRLQQKLRKHERNSTYVSQRTLKEEINVMDVTAAQMLLKTTM